MLGLGGGGRVFGFGGGDECFVDGKDEVVGDGGRLSGGE